MSQKLLNACENGDFDMVKALLTDKDNFTNIHYQNGNGYNALIYACMKGHLEVMKYLLTSEDLTEHAHLYDENINGYSLLMCACSYDKWEIVQYLIIEQNMTITKQTRDLLIENHLSDVLNIIEARDLYQKLNNNLTINDIIIKQRKI